MYGKGEGKRLQDLRARVATVDDGLAIDSEFLVTLAQRLAVRLLLPKMPILPEAVDVPTAVDDQCATCAKFLPRNRRVQLQRQHVLGGRRGTTRDSRRYEIR